jgi:hypothetical protein
LSRVGDKAVAHGDVVGMTAANGVYTSSFHSLKGSYQELLLQKEKAKKRASAGGSVAGGDAAATCLVFEYCDLLFKATTPPASSKSAALTLTVAAALCGTRKVCCPRSAALDKVRLARRG